jgi:hypothetical protein
MKDDHRIIIVFGMARSGTTIFTHVLSQHPSIFLYHNVYNYENDLLFSQDAAKIEEIVLSHPNKLVLFKRPWSEKLTSFFKEEMPKAAYFYMLKDFQDISLSWKRTTWVAQHLREASDEEKYEYYQKMLEIGKSFPQVVGTHRFRIIHYNDFIKEPQKKIRECCQILQINPTRKVGNKFTSMFNTSMVRLGGNWNSFKSFS